MQMQLETFTLHLPFFDIPWSHYFDPKISKSSTYQNVWELIETVDLCLKCQVLCLRKTLNH